MEARILGYEHAGPAVIRKKETRPEAADYGRSKLRNQRRIDFLRSTGGWKRTYGAASEALP